MSKRKVLATATAAAATVLTISLPTAAHAAKATEQIDRSIFDATPERTVESLHLDGPTAGELGGAIDLTITAVDGSLPTDFGSSEPVHVDAVVTVRPGTVVTVRTDGEASAHIVDGTLQVVAFFDSKDVTFEGYELKKSKLIGDGLISAAHHSFGGQASISGAVRW